MYDRIGWRPRGYSDCDSGSETQPLMSSDASYSSRGATTLIFPDSETSDIESTRIKQPTTLKPATKQGQLELYNASRRPYQVDKCRKNITSWDEQMSSVTYNRFQFYSKLQPYALDDLALSVPTHVIHVPYLTPYISGKQLEGDKRQSSLVTIFAVWNTIMGSSLLTMPWGVQKSGLFMGLVTIILMGLLCLYTAHKILQVQKHYGTRNGNGEVPELATLLLGGWAGKTATFFSLLVLLGALIVYWVLLSNFMFNSVYYTYEISTSIINGKILWEENSTVVSEPVLCQQDGLDRSQFLLDVQPSMFHTIWNLKTVPVVLVFIIGPLINFRNVSFFTKFNSFGTLSILYILIFVVFKSAKFGINIDLSNVTSIHYTSLFETSFPILSGMAALSFFIHNIIITIMKNNRHQENNTRDLVIAYSLVIFTYTFIGMLFYICFPLEKNCISDNLLNNFQNWDLMTVLARVFLFFQLLTVFPLIIFMLRSQFFMTMKKDVYPGVLYVLSFNIVVIIICVLFAIFLPSIGTIIRYTGALCGLFYIFTLPILLHFAFVNNLGKTSKWSAVLHLLIPMIGAANLIAQFFL